MTLAAVPDLTPDPQLVRPVIVTVPNIGAIDIMVQHYEGSGPIVNVREHGQDAWLPYYFVPGVSVEIRES